MVLRRHPWHFRAAALLLAGALALLVQWLAPSVLAGVEEMAGDLSWRVGASAQPERRVVIVDIDEASLKEVGSWPWPRAKTAELADRIRSAGAALQVYDIGFSDPKDGDLRLAESWSRSAVVVGQVFSLDSTVTPETGQVAGRLAQSGCPAFAPQGFGAYGTAADLLAAAPVVGHMTPRIEQDGVVRHLPAIVCHHGAAYPTLSLAALWRVAQPDLETADNAGGSRRVPEPDWQWHRAGDMGLMTSWLAPAAWLTSASLPGTVVPLDGQGNLRVPYRIDRKAFASIPAARVLRGDKDLALLKGAIVLIGATAFGVGDVVATPHAAVASGLEVHAQTLAGLLDRRLPFEPSHAAVLQAGAVLIGAALLLMVTGRPGGRAVRRLPAAGLAGAGLMGLGAAWALLAADLWLPWALPALFVLLASGALAAAEHAQTLLQRERLSAHLGSYLPQPVAERLMGIDPTGKVQVEQRDVSVLVADIRNFSAFAAHRPAEETVALLHAFSSIAVDVVERHGGVVERVAGDSILAVWNAFSACDSHAQRAMDAARELVSATRSLLASNTPEGDGGLIQPLALGIGLEAGNAIVGSFGPTRRRAHAALGEPVSVASRIQQMTTDLSVPILVGPRMASSLQADATESLGEYLLEGLGRHYQLFVPVAWAELVPVDPGLGFCGYIFRQERRARFLDPLESISAFGGGAVPPVAYAHKPQPSRRVTFGVSGSSTMFRWTFCLVLSTAAVAPVSAQGQDATGSSVGNAMSCANLVPTPWPTTVVERRLHLRRMETVRDPCITHAGFLAAYGALWLEEGEPEQARIWLERSLMLDSESLGAQADHALALAALGEPTALSELAAGWRTRRDIPAALRQRVAQAVEPGNQIRLPSARFGQVTARPAQAGRGEASLLIGYENNLAISPRFTELTLTAPEGEVVLPVISTPRKGPAVKADLAWQTAWMPSDRNLVRTGLSLSSRRAPGESTTDWYQLQGAASWTRQWNGWSASAQTDLTWFGGKLTEPYGLLRTRLVLEQVGENCSNAAHVEFDERRQSQTRSADSLTTLLAWRLQCRPLGRRDWQWSLALREAADRPHGDDRPGGAQRSTGAVMRLEHRPSALTTVDLSYGASKLRDETGYSRFLKEGAVRWQRQSYLSLEVARALDWSLMPGAELVVQLTRFRQTSNLELFQHDGASAYTGLRWPW